jgi:hypothetical protein
MKLTKRAPLVHKAAHVLLALLLVFSTTLAVKPVGLVAETNFSPAIPDCQGITIPPPRSSFTIQPGPVSQIGFAIAKDVGKVVAAGQGKSNVSVVVFEERHTSRVAQMEMALMLLRLQRLYGLQLISLEGAMVSDGKLPTAWFTNSADNAETKRSRQAATYQLLRDGEISAAEFISLVRPQVQVRGNEQKDLYLIEPPSGSPLVMRLLNIAQHLLTPSQVREANRLASIRKDKELVDFLLDSNNWVKDIFQKYSNESAAAAEELVALIETVKSKTAELSLIVDPKEESQLNQLKDFFCAASIRTKIMVENTLAMMNQNSAVPVTLNIGAAHTEKAVELLKAAGVSYVVISPLSLANGSRAADLMTKAFQRKQNLGSVDVAGLLGAMLDGRKKPPVVTGKQWYQSKSEIFSVCRLLATAASSGGWPLTDDLKEQLQHFPSIKIDVNSMKIIHKDNQKPVLLFQVVARTDEKDPARTVRLAVGTWREDLVEPHFGEDLDLEKMISDALPKERSKPEPNNREPEKVFVKPIPVQISEDTKAILSTSLKAVEEAVISG